MTLDTNTPTIDVLIVLYRSDQFLRALFETLRRLSIPVKLYLLDNGSSNDTAAKVLAELSQLPFPAYFFRSLTNNGFASVCACPPWWQRGQTEKSSA